MCCDTLADRWSLLHREGRLLLRFTIARGFALAAPMVMFIGNCLR
jgi:hypothetical protein